jgi:hypothetical protein
MNIRAEMRIAIPATGGFWCYHTTELQKVITGPPDFIHESNESFLAISSSTVTLYSVQIISYVCTRRAVGEIAL